MTRVKKEETVNILLIVASVMVVLIIRCQSMLGDSDFFWHITLGRDILMNGKIPVEDTYSWLSSEYGLVETAHSWLSSICLYLSTVPFSGVDVYGAVLFAVVTYTLFQGTVYCLFIRRINGEVQKSIATIISIFAGFFLYGNARPQNIGYILFVIAMHLLIKIYESGSVKDMLLMPLVSVCWANFHGGSLPMLFAFNSLFLVLTLVPDFEAGKVYLKCENRKRVRKTLIGALGLNVLAGLLNPYGVSLFTYFFVTNNAVTKKYVAEWQCGGILSLSSIFSLLCFGYLFMIAKNKYPLYKLMPLVITFLLSGVHVRIGCYSYIFVIILMCEELSQVKTEGGKGISLVPTAIITAVIAVSAVATMSGAAGDLEVRNSNLISNGLKSYLSENKFSRMYNVYDAGGFLVYEGYQSFVDSRADLFTDQILEDSFAIEYLKYSDAAQVRDVFRTYRFDSLLIMKCDGVKPLMCYLSLQDDWEIGYEDEEWLVYIPSVKRRVEL